MAKRKDPPVLEKSSTKRAKPDIPPYHLTPSIKEEDGSSQWPAPRAKIERARQIILECASSQKPVLIVPDKDADGLSAGAILRNTLLLLGLSKELIHVHTLTKGNTVHSPEERIKMAACSPSYIFVLDQGSRPGPRLIDAEVVAALVIDHHHATPNDFPQAAEYVTACNSPPVATSSLLTYEICKPLHIEVSTQCAWLCIVGTHGDLGNTFKWEAPFPDMRETLKKHTKKTLNDVVSLINAPRRTATYDVRSAWDALCDTPDPSTALKNPRLLAARAEVNAEVERCTHAAPQFSPDGKIAVFRIRSEAQVHPVIATRWAGHLQSKNLEIVLVANQGYLPDKVNFSCRIPRCARARDPPVDIIQSLKAYASLPEPTDQADGSGDAPLEETQPERAPLLERLGEDFARGHVQASGGIVSVDEFEELMRRMQIGVKPASTQSNPTKSSTKTPSKLPSQKNTLMSYFSKTGKTS